MVTDWINRSFKHNFKISGMTVRATRVGQFTGRLYTVVIGHPAYSPPLEPISVSASPAAARAESFRNCYDPLPPVVSRPTKKRRLAD